MADTRHRQIGAAVRAGRLRNMPERWHERRRNFRPDVYKFARLEIPGDGVADCVVKNLNRRGAKITLISRRRLPDVVGLRLSSAAAASVCEVLWQVDSEAGLRFI